MQRDIHNTFLCSDESKKVIEYNRSGDISKEEIKTKLKNAIL